MRLLFLYLLGILPLHVVLSQTGEKAGYILQSEQIIIKGKTNINHFECRLNLEVAADSIPIKVKRVSEGYDFSGLALEIPVDAFDCRHQIMTNEFRELLRSDVFPNLHLDIGTAVLGNTGQLKMILNLTVAGKEKDEHIENGYLKSGAQGLVLGGHHKIYLRDYDIEPPKKFFGAVVVENELKISFEVVLSNEL